MNDRDKFVCLGECKQVYYGHETIIVNVDGHMLRVCPKCDGLCTFLDYDDGDKIAELFEAEEIG